MVERVGRNISQSSCQGRAFLCAFVAFLSSNALNTVLLETTHSERPHLTGEETEAEWLSSLPWVCTARKRWNQEDVCQSALQICNVVLQRVALGVGDSGPGPASDFLRDRQEDMSALPTSPGHCRGIWRSTWGGNIPDQDLRPS